MGPRDKAAARKKCNLSSQVCAGMSALHAPAACRIRTETLRRRRQERLYAVLRKPSRLERLPFGVCRPCVVYGQIGRGELGAAPIGRRGTTRHVAKRLGRVQPPTRGR
jgi:hypothetical protein